MVDDVPVGGMSKPKPWRPITVRTLTTLSVVCIFLVTFTLITTPVEAKKQQDGKIAQKLDEYHSTIKCVLNIAEETLPGKGIRSFRTVANMFRFVTS